MSLFMNRVANLVTAESLLAERMGMRSGVHHQVSRDAAMRHSAVWACLRLRADLISTMPVDVFRRVGGVQVEQTKPPVFVTPGGKRVGWMEWCYSTQVDLDSTGNTVGIITARDGLGLPSVIELVDIDMVTFIGKGAMLTKVRIGNVEYDPSQIWHERQFTRAGSPVGMSPIAHAAMTIRGYLSAQQFAAEWFDNSTVPGGHLKNTARTLNRKESLKAKTSFKNAVTSGDVWVSGNDWEYSMLAAKASESGFLEEKQFSVADVCRFLGVPGDMIDADVSSGTVTYANVTQRNLQLLIMNIGPAVSRREDAFSRDLLPQPRYAKLNRAKLLEMDLKSRYEAHGIAIDKRFLAPSEIRELENRAPFTEEQEAEFSRLFGSKAVAPVPMVAKAEQRDQDTHVHVRMPDAQPITIENRFELPAAPEPVAPVVRNEINIPTPVAPNVTVLNDVHVPEQAPPNVTVINDVPVPFVENRVEVQPAEVEVCMTQPTRTETTSTVIRDAAGEITGSHAVTEVIEE